MTTTTEAINQIDRAINLYQEYRAHAKYDDLSDLGHDIHSEVKTIVRATLDRLAPPGSTYRLSIDNHISYQIGSLRALKRDYADGFLATIQGLVRAEVFSDFLEMAEHLSEQGYKDPAAVLVGGVLEEHLRALCLAKSIPIIVSGHSKKADAMNSDLANAQVYNKLDQKNVTAWLDLRNKAAHAKYTEYTQDQVGIMLSAVREFIARVMTN
jgi:hypothetical protein